jgi:hypothetical protein
VILIEGEAKKGVIKFQISRTKSQTSTKAQNKNDPKQWNAISDTQFVLNFDIWI